MALLQDILEQSQAQDQGTGVSNFMFQQTQQDQGEARADCLNVGPGSSSSVTEFDTEVFIDLVRGEPCLWNTSLRSYKEQNKRRNAWNKISEIFAKDGECIPVYKGLISKK